MPTHCDFTIPLLLLALPLLPPSPTATDSLVSPSFSPPPLQYDRRAPQYTTTFQTTRQHIDARMSHVKLNLKEKTMVNLVAVGKSIAAVLK